jgi:hypothetical protein
MQNDSAVPGGNAPLHTEPTVEFCGNTFTLLLRYPVRQRGETVYKTLVSMTDAEIMANVRRLLSCKTDAKRMHGRLLSAYLNTRREHAMEARP